MRAVNRYLAVICSLSVLALFGAQTPAQERSPTSRFTRLAQEDSAEPAGEDAKDKEAKEKEKEEPKPRSASPKRFIPTEKISADSAVSFPVDI